MHETDHSREAAGSAPRPSSDRHTRSAPSLHRSTSSTHSTSFEVKRSRSKHLRAATSSNSLSAMVSCTPEEYAQLPASIQKKYFSHQERLCIAQQSAAQGRKKQHSKLGSWLSSTSTSDLLSTRPSTSAGPNLPKPKSRTQDSKLFQVRFDDELISEEEARWFLSLPEKVKAKRFSREELVSLTARSQRAIRKASGESKRDTAHRRRSVHCLESSARSSIGTALSSSAASTLDNIASSRPSADWGKVEQARAAVVKSTRIPTEVVEISKIKDKLHEQLPAETDRAVETATTASDAEMEILRLYLQRRSLKPKDSSKRSPPDSPPATSDQPAKKRFHHRIHLLTPLPLPPPVLAPPPRKQDSTPFSATARLSRPFLNDEPLALTSEDQPEDTPGDSMSQLRDGAPAVLVQDESQVFELPANEEPQLISTDEDCPYPHLISALSDDGTDDCEKEVHDNVDAESVETVGPRTPSPIDHRDSGMQQAMQQATGDSGIDLPEFADTRSKSPSVLDRHSSTLSYYGSSNHDSIGSRKHALRTSSEEILYAYQRRLTSGVDVETADPLALETLPVCDDNTGAKGAFAVSHSSESSTKAPSKGLRRVLKSFQRL